MFLKLTINTPERRHWCRSGVFIVNFKNIFHTLFFCFYEQKLGIKAGNKILARYKERLTFIIFDKLIGIWYFYFYLKKKLILGQKWLKQKQVLSFLSMRHKFKVKTSNCVATEITLFAYNA